MSQTDVFIKMSKMTDRENQIKEINASIQCMEACLGQGFTLLDYMESQKALVLILQNLNINEIKE